MNLLVNPSFESYTWRRKGEMGIELPQGWDAGNAAWVREMRSYVAEWNRRVDSQKINGVVLYRWEADDWALHDKQDIARSLFE